MTDPWWQQGSDRPVPGPIIDHWPALPELVPADPRAVVAEVSGRQRGFTPDWHPTAGDPGVVLTHAFATAASLVAGQVNRLPEAMARRLASMAGLGLGSAVSAAAIVVVGIELTAPAAVALPERAVLLGPPRPGGSASVFETVRALTVVPATVGAVVGQVGTAARVLEGEAAITPFDLPAFGTSPTPGNRLWLGITPGPDTTTLTLHLALAADVSSSSALTAVAWTALVQGGESPVTVMIDETIGLTRSGIVELRLPDAWRAERHPSADGPLQPHRWLSVRLVGGGYSQPPRLTGVRVNAVRVDGVQTLTDEPIEPLIDPTEPDGRPVYRLRQTPIIAGSVVLEVDSGLSTDPFGLDQPDRATSAEWNEVASLAGRRPEDRVFSVDPTTGQLQFPGPARGAFRRVTARRYRVGGGVVDFPAGTTLALRDNVATLTSAAALTAGGGGAEAETAGEALRRAPAPLRSARRAVTPADYEIEALAAPGGGVARALARPGRDGDDRPRPGWVRLVVVSVRPDADGRPVPPPAALDTVARHLEAHVAPLGVRVAAVPARFAVVRVEARVTADQGAEPAALQARRRRCARRHPQPVRDDGARWSPVRRPRDVPRRPGRRLRPCRCGPSRPAARTRRATPRRLR